MVLVLGLWMVLGLLLVLGWLFVLRLEVGVLPLLVLGLLLASSRGVRVVLLPLVLPWYG